MLSEKGAVEGITKNRCHFAGLNSFQKVWRGRGSRSGVCGRRSSTAERWIIRLQSSNKGGVYEESCECGDEIKGEEECFLEVE